MAHNSKRVMEAAALLLLFSFFALIEGIIRMTINSKPVGGDGLDYWDHNEWTQVPIGVLLAAGCAEVLFGTLGIFIGFFQLFFEQGSATVSLLFAIVQAILGWFVFLTFVIAAPVFAVRNTEGVPDLLSQTEHQYLIIIGNLLGSVTFCWALQGGQFIMILRLMRAQQGRPEQGNALRALVWSGNQIVAAGSTLYVGFVLLLKDFESTTMPVGVPPHVVWFPVLSIVSGAIMFAYGAAGVLAANSAGVAQRLPALWVLCTLAMLVNFSWTFGIVPGLAPPIPGAAQHAGLVFSVTLLPVIHAWRAHHPVSAEDTATMTKASMEQPLPPRQYASTPQRSPYAQHAQFDLHEDMA